MVVTNRQKVKKKSDPRHVRRVELMKALFESSFKEQEVQNAEAKEVIANKSKIDKEITKNAPAWPIDQISPIDLAILRLSVWELLYKKDREPYKAIIDEAVEIAKEYGNDSAAGFVNGVLGAVVKNNKEIVKLNK